MSYTYKFHRKVNNTYSESLFGNFLSKQKFKMNYLAITFIFLNAFIFVFGSLMNFVSSILPKCLVQLFRYGRANISNDKPAYISMMEVPKRWFWHFYLCAVLLQLAVVVTVNHMYRNGINSYNSWLITVLSLTGDRDQTATHISTIIASALFLFHLSRRLYETLFVAIYSNTKMNVLHYLLGYIHYIATILCLVAHSPLLASVGGSVPGISSLGLKSLGLIEITGVVLFLVGNYLQNRAHVGLANLRKGKDKKEATKHQIPRGGLFEVISCPNYFAEILIYCSLSIMYGFQNPTLNHCLFWVTCNQIHSGIMNHQWYITTFKDYPKERKAIIPFVL